ncbi:hypothetical protein K493DRAFT_5847 [Basidiobolus meristosporus CBS 931.73]|uniref:Uncharacterized protein n=1 Tax=Basidiobolus meristosporus CBS 931.73 TaxID=1314790 RepID=A0A1Y1W2W9_9FUNG|nr:hypothetical protein K493DRAFT_5847 [Basidiobolus meristosporus CBS 931.73]|eukprot:ORX67722.1 hypothetical protein K493DRAFT_5847 [Basidiobolus meristosporus CBS 931.73]
MLTELGILLATQIPRALTLYFTKEVLHNNGLSGSTFTFAVLTLTTIILAPFTRATLNLRRLTSFSKWTPVIAYSLAHAFSTLLLLKGLSCLSPLRVLMFTEQGELWQLGLLSVFKWSSKKTGILESSHLLGIGFTTFSLFATLLLDFTQHTGTVLSPGRVTLSTIYSSQIFTFNPQAPRFPKGWSDTCAYCPLYGSRWFKKAFWVPGCPENSRDYHSWPSPRPSGHLGSHRWQDSRTSPLVYPFHRSTVTRC